MFGLFASVPVTAMAESIVFSFCLFSCERLWSARGNSLKSGTMSPWTQA